MARPSLIHINGYNPFSEDKSDNEFWVGTIDGEKHILHGCEGAIGITWTADQAREAARRLFLMAEQLDKNQPEDYENRTPYMVEYTPNDPSKILTKAFVYATSPEDAELQVRKDHPEGCTVHRVVETKVDNG